MAKGSRGWILELLRGPEVERIDLTGRCQEVDCTHSSEESDMLLRALVTSLLALLVFAVPGMTADKQAKKNKNQMVKGTIKSVDVKSGVLVVSQKVKGENVDRQLDITEKTEFVITIDGKKQEVSGKEGLALLDEAVGAKVSVKCDKDVNVLKVTATVKKKKKK
jgi:hypothetical protein